MSQSNIQSFPFNKEYLSQIPALQELIALGYEYLSPEQALFMRSAKNSNVLLESVLREQLKKFNSIPYKGKTYHFSEANIQKTIRHIKTLKTESEFEKYRIIHDRLFEFDFDKKTKAIERQMSYKDDGAGDE